MKIVEKDGKRLVFDIIRKKYVVLTPEEEVRQQVIHWMIEKLNYPKASISVEKTFHFNERRKRYDIVVYKDAQPWLLVECKSEKVKLDQGTFEQAGYYNLELNVPYLFITNGIRHFVLEINKDKPSVTFLSEMPAYRI